MTTAEQKLIDKVKKLLALADNNSNENEAQAAYARQALIQLLIPKVLRKEKNTCAKQNLSQHRG